jgi:hypothetical protein
MPNKTSILLRPVGSFFPRERLRGIWVFGGIPLLAFVAALVIRGVPFPEECDSGMIFFGRMLFIGVALLGIPVIMELLAENGARAWIPRKRSLLAGAGVLAVLWLLLHPLPSAADNENLWLYGINRYTMLLHLLGILAWAWIHIHACAIRMRSFLFGWIVLLSLSWALAGGMLSCSIFVQSIAGLGCMLILLELMLGDLSARKNARETSPIRLSVPPLLWMAFVLAFVFLTLFLPQSIGAWSRRWNPLIVWIYYAAIILPFGIFLARTLSRFGENKFLKYSIFTVVIVATGLCLFDIQTHRLRAFLASPADPTFYSPVLLFLMVASVDVLLVIKGPLRKITGMCCREESESSKALIQVPRLPLHKWKGLRSWRWQLVYLVLFLALTPAVCYAAVFYYYKSNRGFSISFAEMASIPAYWYGYWQMVFGAYLLGGILIPCWLLLPRHLSARLSECWTSLRLEELSLTRLGPWDIIWGILAPPLIVVLIPVVGTICYSYILTKVLMFGLPVPYQFSARFDHLLFYLHVTVLFSLFGVLFSGLLLIYQRKATFRGALALIPALFLTLITGLILAVAASDMFLPNLFASHLLRHVFLFVICLVIWRKALMGLRAELDNFNPAA